MKSILRQLIVMVGFFCGLLAPAWAQFNIPSGGAFDVPGGTVDMGCLAVEVEGALSITAGQFSTTSNLNIAGTGAFNGSGGVLAVGGDLSNAGSFNAGAGTVMLTDGCVGNTSQLSGTMVFQNLTLSSTTGRTFVVPAGSNITVLGTLTLQGAPGQSIQLVSSGGGTAVINLGAGATVSRSFTTVAGNVQIGAAQVAASIPTLSEYGIMLLVLILGLATYGHHHRRAARSQRS